MLSLNLDPSVVLSAWEEMGGGSFYHEVVGMDEIIDLDLVKAFGTAPKNCEDSEDNVFSAIFSEDYPGTSSDLFDGDNDCTRDLFGHELGNLVDSWGLSPFQDGSFFDGCELEVPLVKSELNQSSDEQHNCSAGSLDGCLVPEGLVAKPSSSTSSGGSCASILPKIPSSSCLVASVAGNQTAPGHGSSSPTCRDADVVRTRKECLERYKEKKARRLYAKKIRYHLRKINADKRPRIKGRFVKKEELEEYLKGQGLALVDEEELVSMEEEEAEEEEEETGLMI